jgi:hypothetical protein
MNNIQLSGRLTKAIRSNTVQGTPVVNFTVAVELGMKPQLVTMNGKEVLAMVPATSYLDAAAWGPDAAAASHLEAGQEVSFTLNGLGSKGREYNGKILSDVTARVSSIVAGAKAKAKATAPVAAATVPSDEIPF